MQRQKSIPALARKLVRILNSYFFPTFITTENLPLSREKGNWETPEKKWKSRNNGKKM